MNTRLATTATTLSAVALLALTSACGGKDTASDGSSTSTTSSTSTASSAPESSSATSSQPASAEASASSAAPAPAGDKAYTDAQLASMLKGVRVNGQALSPAPARMQEAIKNGGGSLAQVQKTMQDANITPASCKKAMLEGMAKTPNKVPSALGMGSGMSSMVVLRSLESAEAAKDYIDAVKASNAACSSYTMVMKASGQTITAKATNKEMPVQSAASDDEYAQATRMNMSGRDMSTSTAVSHVGNVLVQVTYQGAKPVDAAQVSKDLEAVSKAVAAKA